MFVNRIHIECQTQSRSSLYVEYARKLHRAPKHQGPPCSQRCYHFSFVFEFGHCCENIYHFFFVTLSALKSVKSCNVSVVQNELKVYRAMKETISRVLSAL